MKLRPSNNQTTGQWGDTVDVEAFYRANKKNVIARMRRPSRPTKNTAALIVAQCERDPDLRAEATRALEAARRAREASGALDFTMRTYGSTTDA
ncbi:MAG TPA: hypothetical protein VFR41_06675 [Acidimicrobiia bacterium]|nr:hypothetical protein [Acidimicrobiia bacterium]